MDEFSHLKPEARALLDLPKEARIHEMKRDQWIGYPTAKGAIDRLEELLAHPRVVRMPNLLIIGRTNNGKTQILKRFCELHPATDNIGDGAVSVPVLYVQAPTVPDERRLYTDILDKLFAKYSYSDHPAKLLSRVKDLLSKVGVRMLIIDELNNLVSGTTARQRQFLTVLKYLSNELQIPLVGAGTEDAVRAIQTDPQLSNRFTPITLPRWPMGADFRRLMATCEQVIPLRSPSNLSDKAIAADIWARADGTIGETMRLLKDAAKLAIQTGHEKIDKNMLDNCGYEAPSERKKRLIAI